MRRASLSRGLGLALSLCLPVPAASAQDPCVVGEWKPPFQHGGWNQFDPQDPWYSSVYAPLGAKIPGYGLVPTVFEAIHMALIPTGADQGKVLVVDWSLDIVALTSDPSLPDPFSVSEYKQRYAVVGLSPTGESPTFTNALLDLTAEPPGDLMCGGHSWTPDGQLLWVGGSHYTPDEIIGHKKSWIYTPRPMGAAAGPGTWTRAADMNEVRWYPTVTSLPLIGAMMVSGGTYLAEKSSVNSYELYVPGEDWFAGPLAGPDPTKSSPFFVYPRIHLLPMGTGNGLSWLFYAGDLMDSALIDVLAYPEYWWPGNWSGSPVGHRDHGTSILQSNFLDQTPVRQNQVWRIGGAVLAPGPTEVTSDSVEVTDAGDPFAAWTAGPSLNHARMDHNAVLLPDGSVLVVGGTRNVSTGVAAADGDGGADGTGGAEHDGIVDPVPALRAELLAPGATEWVLTEPMASSRNYHSTALLLPSGLVLTAGGDAWYWEQDEPYVGRTWDYQVYVPPYLACGKPRPRILSAPSRIDYSGVHTVKVQLPGSHTVEQVVLMAPGSVTHSFDMNQRRVELPILGSSGNVVTFQAPARMGFAPQAPAHAPPGHYMLFVLSEEGVPSVARWVELTE